MSGSTASAVPWLSELDSLTFTGLDQVAPQSSVRETRILLAFSLEPVKVA
ncbi:MAG: hypothetical protein QM767_01675 [Anaeromyxobacter sp.]